MVGWAKKVWLFYRDGFRNQTWGRPLIWLVVLKFFLTRNRKNTETYNLAEKQWKQSSGPDSSLP